MTTKTYQKTSKTQKYLDALNDLYTICSYTDSFSIMDFKKTANLPHEFFTCVYKGGLVRKEGGTSNAKYYWNTIKPNIHMAKKLHQEMSKVIRENNRKYKAEKKKPAANTLKPKKVTPTKNTITPDSKKLVGWRGQIGFIKFSLTPIYK